MWHDRFEIVRQHLPDCKGAGHGKMGSVIGIARIWLAEFAVRIDPRRVPVEDMTIGVVSCKFDALPVDPVRLCPFWAAHAAIFQCFAPEWEAK